MGGKPAATQAGGRARKNFFLFRFLPVYIAYLSPLLLALYTDEGQASQPLRLGQVCDRPVVCVCVCSFCLFFFNAGHTSVSEPMMGDCQWI